ncbi:MAG: TIM-barrel domain-containing protein [Eubacteriales bacterium]
MYKLTFGEPEKLVPSRFCDNFRFMPSSEPMSYPAEMIEVSDTARGYTLYLPCDEGEDFYGLGLQLKGWRLNGHELTMSVNADPREFTGDSHAPVPFFVSSKGYGIWFDTFRYAEFRFGGIRNGKKCISVTIPGTHGVDTYIFEADNITGVCAEYNMLSGGGAKVADWGLGTLYRCYSKYNSDEVCEIGRYFIDKKLPVSMIGLEPGWQSRSYSCSYVWNKENYPDPEGTIASLREMGYHVNLWEHAFTHPDSPIYQKIKPYSGDFSVWGGVVPDFADKNAVDIFAGYHSEKLVSLGIDGFKLDECDSSDYTGHWSFPHCSVFPSGFDGEQYHSAFGTLYCKAISKAFGDNETFSQVRSMGSLAASYPYALYSDLYDYKEFRRGVCSAGFSGLLWAPEVRHASSSDEFLKRLATAVLSPFCLINAWYCEEVPWKAFDCEAEVRSLLELRQELKPVLKTAYEEYVKKGISPCRALVSDYTSDIETRAIDDEFLIGDKLLAAPLAPGENTREVYLPTQDRWEDYFTGKPVPSGRFVYNGNGIPLYVKI